LDGGGRLARTLALVLALALLAAACGGDSDEDGASGGAASTEGSGGSQRSDGGDGASDGTAPEGMAGVPEDEGDPVRGGTLVYGVEADTANPWAPYRASYAPAGYVVLRSIADPLFVVDADRNWVPILAESLDHNDDYTQWTFTIRDGIKFHDGTPLDAEAVKLNIESCVGSSLTGAAFANIGSVEADGMTVTITTSLSPWVVLPNYFGGGACSYMMSAQWLKSLPDLPQRTQGNRFYDPAIAALPADGDPAKPVATGPFVFQSYTPGNGNSFVATRNEDYWRGPNGITGEDLPYLDRIEIVPAVDIESRSNGLRSGQFDIMHTSNADEIDRYLDDDDFETITSNAYGDTGYIMFNVAQGNNVMTGAPIDPQGANADNPLTTLSCRRALAMATDRQAWIDDREAGLTQVANGPFPPVPRARRRAGPDRDGQVPGRAGHQLHLVQLQHDERSGQRGEQRADDLDVGGGVRRQGERHHHADRAGPVHRPRPHRRLRRPRLAQPPGDRPRHPAAVVDQRLGRADRPGGVELRAVLGPGHRREPPHDPHQPGPRRSPGGGRGGEPALRRAGVQPLVLVAGVEHHLEPVRQRGVPEGVAGRCRSAPHGRPGSHHGPDLVRRRELRRLTACMPGPCPGVARSHRGE
jgi:ABC-type transport system substrate-binding protein